MNNRNEFLKYAVHHRGMSSHTVEDYISATTRTHVRPRQHDAHRD